MTGQRETSSIFLVKFSIKYQGYQLKYSSSRDSFDVFRTKRD